MNLNFYRKMRIACLAIPEGKVATYGQIAMLCGKPNNSRQVGYGWENTLDEAMRMNREYDSTMGCLSEQYPGYYF